MSTQKQMMGTPIPEVTPQSPAPAKQRRRYSNTFKQQVVAAVLEGRDSVSVIARRHDLNANLVFKWKREQQHRDPGAHSPNELIPVTVTPPVSVTSQGIDIELPTGGRINVYDGVSAATLATVLSALRT